MEKAAIFLLLLCAAANKNIDDVTVTLSHGGIVRGRMRRSVTGRRFLSFQGIPYAKPPLGELRFQPPKPAEPWNGTLDATKEGYVCTQNNLVTGELLGEEDCLFVNVFTQELTTNRFQLRPVMVWFHQGSYAFDSGNEANYGPDYLMDTDVVLVTLNYRLDVLGFLSTADHVVAGNMGLKDQTMALRWIRTNAGHFGGDADLVTIFGQSSGGSAVGYHMLSPLSKGLFHRAISMSGAPLSSSEIQRTPRGDAFRLGAAVGCPVADDVPDAATLLLLCLRTVPARTLVKNSLKALSPQKAKKIFPFSFSPVIEQDGAGAFIAEDPGVLLDAGRFHHVPFLSGFVSNEGKLLLNIMQLPGNAHKLAELDHNFEEKVGQELRLTSDAQQRAAAARLKQFYFHGKPIDDSQLYELSLFLSDFYLVEGIDRFARALAANSSQPSYLCRFSFESNLGSIWEKFHYTGPPEIPGAEHGDDNSYLFESFNGTRLEKITPEQENVRHYMTTLWSNFAKYGNPTPSMEPLLDALWSPMTSQNPAFLDIDAKLTMRVDADAKRLSLWREMFPVAVCSH